MLLRDNDEPQGAVEAAANFFNVSVMTIGDIGETCGVYDENFTSANATWLFAAAGLVEKPPDIIITMTVQRIILEIILPIVLPLLCCLVCCWWRSRRKLRKLRKRMADKLARQVAEAQERERSLRRQASTLRRQVSSLSPGKANLRPGVLCRQVSSLSQISGHEIGQQAISFGHHAIGAVATGTRTVVSAAAETPHALRKMVHAAAESPGVVRRELRRGMSMSQTQVCKAVENSTEAVRTAPTMMRREATMAASRFKAAAPSTLTRLLDQSRSEVINRLRKENAEQAAQIEELTELLNVERQAANNTREFEKNELACLVITYDANKAWLPPKLTFQHRAAPPVRKLLMEIMQIFEQRLQGSNEETGWLPSAPISKDSSMIEAHQSSTVQPAVLPVDSLAKSVNLMPSQELSSECISEEVHAKALADLVALQLAYDKRVVEHNQFMSQAFEQESATQIEPGGMCMHIYTCIRMVLTSPSSCSITLYRLCLRKALNPKHKMYRWLLQKFRCTTCL